MDVCEKSNLCAECDDECWHSGKMISDCPKYRCDNKIAYDCRGCEFLEELYRDYKDHRQ